MNNANALRINGYSADANGIILRREGRRSYRDESTCVMRVTFEKESKGASRNIRVFDIFL
jgi:hypothetical protein